MTTDTVSFAPTIGTLSTNKDVMIVLKTPSVYSVMEQAATHLCPAL